MDNKDAFTVFWTKNCHKEPLPDLDFFNSVEGLQERIDLCKQNLKGALCTLEQEGLLLRFLSKLSDTNEYDDFRGDVCGVLRHVFSDSLGFIGDVDDLPYDSSLNELNSGNGAEKGLESDPLTEDNFPIRGESFSFTIDSKIKEPRSTLDEGRESESGPSLGGSYSGVHESADDNDSNVHLPGITETITHSSTKTSANRDAELLSNQNNREFSRGESHPSHDLEILSNEYGEDGDESNEEVLMAKHDSGKMDSTERKSFPSQESGLKEEIISEAANTVFSPFKSGIGPEPNERKCKWNVERESKNDGMQLSETDEVQTKSFGSHSVEDGNEPQNNITVKCNEPREMKGAVGVESRKIMNSKVCEVDSSVEIKKRDKERNVNLSDLEDRPTLAEEETFFVDLSEEKEALELPDVEDQETGIVNELISYLEGIEIENSSEEEGEDSAASEGSGQMLLGFQENPSAIFRKKQLQSVLSTTSGLSTDSCLSPWTLDRAMAEIHSADSSDQDDAPADSGEPSPVEANPASVSIPNVTEGGVPEATLSPVRPPRRRSKRGMVRSHTVGIPKEIKTAVRAYSEEDDVFRKEEEGYDGKVECQN